MSDSSSLQELVDEIVDTSRQQWLLRVVAVLAPLGAVLATAAENGRWWPFGLFLVPALATAAALRPDNETALYTIVVIAWHWLATVGGVDTPWLPVVASCMVVHHVVIALSATVPTGGTVPPTILGSWARNTLLAGVLIVFVWGLVVAFDRREPPGNAFLTACALAVVAGAAVMIRSRSLPKPDVPGAR